MAKRTATPLLDDTRTVKQMGAQTFLRAIPTPEGFTRTDFQEQVEQWAFPRNGKPEKKPVMFPGVRFTREDVTLVINLRNADDEWAPGDGHTTFSTVKGQFSFDRLGVEDSFYVNADDTPETVAATLAEQIQRVAETKARHMEMVSVPQIGFLVTPARKAQITADLKAGKGATFTPSGFGTGYTLSTRQRFRYDKRASRALEGFFGVSPIYLTLLDCD